MKYCCELFGMHIKTGDIYGGILFPNNPRWMTDWDRVANNKLLSKYCDSAGNDGVAWNECPFCDKKLEPPILGKAYKEVVEISLQ